DHRAGEAHAGGSQLLSRRAAGLGLLEAGFYRRQVVAAENVEVFKALAHAPLVVAGAAVELLGAERAQALVRRHAQGKHLVGKLVKKLSGIARRSTHAVGGSPA
nr:hypothetical protein [Tanacetum cinerariifolium]